ncbi:MAG: TonB family protein [Betaproteobacteria bacterium]
MHVLLAYALVSGLAKKVVDKVLVTETKVVEAPPPPPPPPPKDLPPPPKNLPPPPVYVPPPPVDVPPPPIAPSIQTTTVMPPPAPDVRLTPPAPPAPPAPNIVARAARVNATDPSCRPDYPAAAARAQAVGTSRIRFTVDANGKVTAADVIGSSGPTREHRLLDNAAKSALATCPITVGVDAEGHPVGTQVEVIYTWKLE